MGTQHRGTDETLLDDSPTASAHPLGPVMNKRKAFVLVVPLTLALFFAALGSFRFMKLKRDYETLLADSQEKDQALALSESRRESRSTEVSVSGAVAETQYTSLLSDITSRIIFERIDADFIEGFSIHPDRPIAHSFDGNLDTGAVFVDAKGGFVIQYSRPIEARSICLIGRSDATTDLILSGRLVINDTLTIPLHETFGRLNSETTCLNILLSGKTRIQKLRLTCSQNVNMPGISEILFDDTCYIVGNVDAQGGKISPVEPF